MNKFNEAQLNKAYSFTQVSSDEYTFIFEQKQFKFKRTLNNWTPCLDISVDGIMYQYNVPASEGDKQLFESLANYYYKKQDEAHREKRIECIASARNLINYE